MPGMDGIGVLRALRAGKAEPVPVVVVSAFSPAHGARAVDALAEGAFDLVAKPAMGESIGVLHRRARQEGPRRRRERQAAPPRAAVRPAPVPAAPGAPRPRPRMRTGAKPLVLIASSTGGPKALGELIPQLPAPLGAGVADRPAHAAGLHRLAGQPAGRPRR